MHLSIREVFQLADRCFSAAGFAEGSAKANAETIWWTEAYRGSGLEILHDHLTTLPDLDRTRVSLRELDTMGAILDSAGQPSLVTSTPALDLCCSRADRHGAGLVYSTIAEDDDSLPTLGHLAHKAADRGFVSVVCYSDSDGTGATIIGTPNSPQPLLAEKRLATPSVSYRKFVDVVQSGLNRYDENPLTQAFFERPTDHRQYSAADERMLERLLEQGMEPVETSSPDVDPGYALVCLDPRHPRTSERLQQVAERYYEANADDFTETFPPEQIEQRSKRLLNDGVEVDRDVWRDIFEFSSEILAPQFEGSEKGAGFGLNE